MISGSVKLTNRIAFGAKLMEARLGVVVQQTGQDLAQATRDNMYPGHAYDTGYMQEHTTWKRTGNLTGQVVVDADYAAFVEFGTTRMAPRPFLQPAIDASWPKDLYKHAVLIRAEITS